MPINGLKTRQRAFCRLIKIVVNNINWEIKVRPGVVLNRACITGFFCPKLGQVSNPQWLTYYKTIITHLLFEYPPPLGERNWHHFENREAPGKRRDPWNTKDHVTAITNKQKVTTTRLVRLCMLSRVLPVQRRQRKK